MAESLNEQVIKYLTDAHAIEVQAIQQLEAAAGIAGDEDVARIYREHLEETREQERLVTQRLEALGESPSRIKDLGMRGAAMAMGLFAQVQPDTPGKVAVQAFSFEHYEIAAYELLRRVAQRAGDTETVQLADKILAQERAAAEKVASTFDRAVELSLQAHGAVG